MRATPRCPVCGDKVPTCHSYSRELGGVVGAGTADGKPPERGQNGDNLTCSQLCASTLAIRLVRMNPSILNTLPPEWRADLVPWDSWKVGAKLNGKRAWVVELGQKSEEEATQHTIMHWYDQTGAVGTKGRKK